MDNGIYLKKINEHLLFSIRLPNWISFPDSHKVIENPTSYPKH